MKIKCIEPDKKKRFIENFQNKCSHLEKEEFPDLYRLFFHFLEMCRKYDTKVCSPIYETLLSK